MYTIHPSQQTWSQQNRQALTDAVNHIMRDSARSPKETGQFLRHLRVNLHQVRFVIVGQDPYTRYSLCTGRTFEPNRRTWSSIFTDPQANGASFAVLIQRLVEVLQGAKGDTTFDSEGRERALSYIQHQIQEQKWAATPEAWFDHLEQQGVLFMNRYWTVGSNALDHRNTWKSLSNSYFQFLESTFLERNQHVVWILFGNEAQDIPVCEFPGGLYRCSYPTPQIRREKLPLSKATFFERTGINWRGVSSV